MIRERVQNASGLAATPSSFLDVRMRTTRRRVGLPSCARNKAPSVYFCYLSSGQGAIEERCGIMVWPSLHGTKFESCIALFRSLQKYDPMNMPQRQRPRGK
ncbi:unnamed protein product [Ectocarpus sp. 12 AP-2014]